MELAYPKLHKSLFYLEIKQQAGFFLVSFPFIRNKEKHQIVDFTFDFNNFPNLTFIICDFLSYIYSHITS